MDRRSARGVRRGLAYNPSRSVIDPMQEIAARDRQRGADVSNPFPAVRPAQAITELDTGEPSAFVPTPVVPTPPSATTRPYEGMNVFRAMVTPMSTAEAGREARVGGSPQVQATAVSSPRIRRPGFAGQPEEIPAPRPMPSPQGGAMRQTPFAQAINDLMADNSVPEIEQYRRLTLMANAAAAAAMDAGQEKMALGYSSMAARAQKAHEHLLAMRRVSEQETLASQQRDKDREATITGAERVAKAEAEGQLSIEKYLAERQTQAASLAGNLKDAEQPLRDNPGLPISEYARNYMQSASNASKVALTQGQLQSLENDGRQLATRYRVTQHVTEMMTNPQAPTFDGDHPGLEELRNHYRAELAKNPGKYDDYRTELAGILVPSVMNAAVAAAKINNKPLAPDYHQKMVKYSEQLLQQILGPRRRTLIQQGYDNTIGRIYGQ